MRILENRKKAKNITFSGYSLSYKEAEFKIVNYMVQSKQAQKSINKQMTRLRKERANNAKE